MALACACTYALDYPGADASDVSFDDFIPRRTDDERTAGIDGGQKCVAVLQAGLEAQQSLMKFIEEPFEFSSL